MGAAPAAYAQRDLVAYIIPAQGSAPVVRMVPSDTAQGWQRTAVRLSPIPTRSTFSIPDDAFGVVLIGKDGGTKLVVKREALTNAQLFETIDAMPMRKREMKSRD